jgi:phosphotransferase system IIB component
MIRLLFFSERTYIDWLNDNYWWPVILCVLIIAVGLYFIYFYRPKTKTAELNSDEIITIMNLFGGRDNIENITKSGSRYKFDVKKVEKCNLEGMKDLGCTGIFVSGTQVKLIFPFSADELLDKFSS